jgi:hypothetical protein
LTWDFNDYDTAVSALYTLYAATEMSIKEAKEKPVSIDADFFPEPNVY